MTDKVSKEIRSYTMSQVKSENTKPELIVRKFLFSKGLRYRVNDKRLPGKPDLVFPKYKTVIFVNGCFWHHHDCRTSLTPKSNTDFWNEKIKKNIRRDTKNYEDLKKLGWKIIVVWECELTNKKRKDTLRIVFEQLTSTNLNKGFSVK